MSADRRRRRALSENELLGVYVVLGAGVGLVLALVFGWPPLPHVTLGVVASALWRAPADGQRARPLADQEAGIGSQRKESHRGTGAGDALIVLNELSAGGGAE